MMRPKTLLAAAALLFAALSLAVAAGNWSAAETKAKDFNTSASGLNALVPKEAKSLVTAICEAEEADRAAVAKDASARVKDTVTRAFGKLEDQKDDALAELSAVLADPSLKAHHSKAASYKAEVDKRWQTVEKMTKSLRGANHPVVAWMLDRGKEVHADRQERCDASEVTVGSGRADCVMATGSTCLVIELKPKNKTAIEKGTKQARIYAKDLNDELKKTTSDVMKKLIRKKPEFAKCTSFTRRVDCYTLCPGIDADGDFDKVSVDWDEDCR